MNVSINANCTGCEECIQIVPDVFALTPDYLAEVLTPTVAPEFQDDVLAAAKNCPARAIEVS